MSEDREIKAQWAYVLGEGRVIVYGLTEAPLVLTPQEAENLAGLEHHAKMAKTAPQIMAWLEGHGLPEEKVSEMLGDLALKAQTNETMSGLLKAFGNRYGA
jgi:hypothetical protein